MIEEILGQIDELKTQYQRKNPHSKQSFEEDFKLRYTYESNAIEGNTLTLMETKVVLEGVGVGGKSLREHYEVINHHQAVALIEEFAKDSQPLSEYEIKSIHSLILKNINEQNAGAYRNCEVRSQGRCISLLVFSLSQALCKILSRIITLSKLTLSSKLQELIVFWWGSIPLWMEMDALQDL